jgi:hypothetical protein
MQLGAHTQLEVARVPQGEKVVKQEFWELKRNYAKVSRKHG